MTSGMMKISELCAYCVHVLVVNETKSGRGLAIPLEGTLLGGDTDFVKGVSDLLERFDLSKPLYDPNVMPYAVRAVTTVNGTRVCWRHAANEVHHKLYGHARYWQ